MTNLGNRVQSIVAVVIGLGSLGLLWQAQNLPVVNPYGAANAGFWPSIILGFLIVMCLIWAIRGAGAGQEEVVEDDQEPRSFWRPIVIGGMVLLLPVAIVWIGFLLASLVGLVALMLAYGERGKLALVLTPLLSVAAFYGLFILMMGLAPPRGVGPFWDLSLWFY